MRLTLILFSINLVLFGSFAWSAGELPKSINVISGVPLTLPEAYAKSLGIKAEENTGGWGDVMSNVTMALELKKQFPEISVRLLVTLNDDDDRPFVNKVRNFIPQILKVGKNEASLDPDIKTTQYYRGVEIYFVSVPSALSNIDLTQIKDGQKAAINAAVQHVPYAELGLQYSANDSPINNLVLKSQNLQLYFSEYSENTASHAFSSFKTGSPQIKLNSGPINFGVYGFGSNEDGLHSRNNKKQIEGWLASLAKTNPILQKHSLKLAEFDLAFAYAGDPEMIDDYVSAVKQLASKDSKRKTVIVYKGSGDIKVIGNKILIPLGAHPKELAHALISESTYSPLVTGDGSLSSALETTTEGKSLLYENVGWKAQAMGALLGSVFKSKPELIEAAQSLLIPQTKDLKGLKMSRKKRIEKIKEALQNIKLNAQFHLYFSRRASSLNLADNTLNMFQFRSIFDSLQKGNNKGLLFSDGYLVWLTELTKKFQARHGLPLNYLHKQLDDKTYGRAHQLLEKWYSLFTLWELNDTVAPESIRQVVSDTSAYLVQRETSAKDDVIYDLQGTLDQINGSERARSALYQALKTDRAAYADFNLIRDKYNEQSKNKMFLIRQNLCVRYYSH